MENNPSADELRELHNNLKDITDKLKLAMDEATRLTHEAKTASMNVLKLKLDKDVIMDAIMTEKKLIDAAR